MSKVEFFTASGLVVGMFLGQPQLGAVIGCAIGGGSVERVPDATDRQKEIARELARTLSYNRVGLWLVAGSIAIIFAILIRGVL